MLKYKLISPQGISMKTALKALLLVMVTLSILQAQSFPTKTSKWRVYDAQPSGASITVINDFRVKLKGNGTANGYILGGSWKNKHETKIAWAHKFSENFIIYVSVQTLKGHRYLYYTPIDKDLGIRGSNKNYIHHGLGAYAKRGVWETFVQDLQQDLQDFEPNNKILSVDAFLVRGSGMIGDIELFSTASKILSIDEDIIASATNDTVRLYYNEVMGTPSLSQPAGVISNGQTVRDLALINMRILYRDQPHLLKDNEVLHKLVVLYKNSIVIYNVDDIQNPILLQEIKIDYDLYSLSVIGEGYEIYVSVGDKGIIKVIPEWGGWHESLMEKYIHP